MYKVKYLSALLILAAVTAPYAHADDVEDRIKAYLANFEGEKGFSPLVRGLKFEYERLQNFRKSEPQWGWAVAVSIEPSGRYAVGFGKGESSSQQPDTNAKRFCNKQRKVRSMKAKCRVFVLDDTFRKPYKR